MTVFGAYSRYYNLLYKDKDYGSEATYVLGLLAKHGKGKVRTLLDIGCGTGTHGLLMAKAGMEVDGVDRSEEMIRVGREKAAREPRMRFSQGDAATFKLGKRFDAAVSLFHVMSYQTSNASLKDCFARAHEHLVDGGLFLFDFWYGPGVLTDRPALRVKEMEDDSIRVWRKATPALDANRNTVEVKYDILVEDKASGRLERLSETHLMRYLFAPELEFMLQAAGFRVVDFLEWMSPDREPGFSSWNACMVAEKARS